MKNDKDTRETMFPACCDIRQDLDKIVLRMEMPGVTKDTLDIRIDGDLLIINGRKNLPDLSGKYFLKEIRNGMYHHEFTIDDTVDRNKIDASIKNGVVRLELCLKESVKPKKITVNAG